MTNQCKRPIEFLMHTKDGSVVNQKVEGDQAVPMLKKHGKPFSEAGRDLCAGGHLLAFCIKNGMTLEDILYLQNNQGTPKAEQIQNQLDKSRKEFMELSCCENESILEERTTNFYFDYINKAKDEFEKIKAMPKGPERLKQAMALSSVYYSLGYQTLRLGYNDPFGKKIEANVNAKIKENGGNFAFDGFFGIGYLMQSINQASERLNNVDQKIKQSSKNEYYLRGYSHYISSITILSDYLDEIIDNGKNMDEVFAAIDEKTMDEIGFRVAGGGDFSVITTTNAAESPENWNAMQDYMLDKDINKHGGPVPDEGLDAQLDELLIEAKESDSKNFTSRFMPTASNKRFAAMIEAAENLKTLREQGASKEQLEIGSRELQCAANEYVRNKDGVDAKANTNAGNRKRIGEKFMSLAGSKKLFLQGKLEKSIEKYKAEIDRSAERIGKDWVNIEANFTPYKDEPKKEVPKAPKTETKTGLEYIEKLEKRSTDKILNPDSTSTDLRKSLATMMTCKTVREKLEKDGANMSGKEKAALGDKKTLLDSTAKLYKSDEFNKLCDELTDKEIMAAVKTADGIDKQYSRLKEIAARPDEPKMVKETKIEKTAERII